jgi:ubiquinone/menaquinone biosynthesis C-methylase UbiE
VTAPVDYDTELSRYSAALSRAWAVRADDHVLDIGCGTGQTTREAARMAPAGSALGVDVSAPAVERARELARADGLHNVTFEHADAQTHRFAEGYFDLAISRFGTMFFDDPVAAFGNIGRALRPAGRLVMLVWQTHDRNEWDVAIHEALTEPDGSGVVAGDGADPFSLADPATVERILGAAGFADIGFTPVRELICFGADTAAALTWVRGFVSTREFLERLDPGAAASALARLREVLAAHQTDDGVQFDSRAWIVSAHRR